jgi:hypothetical protein
MAAVNEWQEDDVLKETLVKLVEKSLQRTEILSFVERDFPHYSWSLRSLDRRLRHFNIYYQDRNVTVAEARGPTRPHEAYEISKSRDFEPDFLISNLISVDF